MSASFVQLSIAQLLIFACFSFSTAQTDYYSSFGDVIKTKRNKEVSSDASCGDYEFVISGASEGAEETNRGEPLDRSLMTGQDFTLIGVAGTKDRRSEIWVRTNRGQDKITISGNANDVAYCVTTMFRSKISFKISDITFKGDYAQHGSSSVRLRLPPQSGIKIVSIFFDDPVQVTNAGSGIKLLEKYGHGDGDGYAAILYDSDVSPPPSLSIQNNNPMGEEYASLAISIRTSGGSGGSGSFGSGNKGDTLGIEQRLYDYDYLQSPNGKYRAYFQDDGDFVLRDSDCKSLWSTSTRRRGGNFMVMQSDGNLVIYNSNEMAVWVSFTWRTGATKLVLKDSGVLKIEKSNGADVMVLN